MSTDQSTDPLPLPIEIIFSCSICQATILEVYKPGESNPGLREANSETDTAITKLWLTECGHLTCGKHLPGGGAPFHRHGDLPKAPCPICSKEKNDQKEKTLYGIRGCSDGSFDTGIPKSWFDSPPIKLDGQGKGMDALRFHYLSLIRFGTNMLAKFRKSQATTSEYQKKASDERSDREKLNDQATALKSRIADLEKCEEELRPWKERESKIKYYLGAFQELTRENTKLKEKLSALGYAVPKQRFAYDTGANGTSIQSDQPLDRSQDGFDRTGTTQNNGFLSPNIDLNHQTRVRQDTSSSRTLSGPPPPVSAPRSAPIRNLHTFETVQNEFQSRRKRQRETGDFESNDTQFTQQRDDKRNSSELMPPPPLPNRTPSITVTRDTHETDPFLPRSPYLKRIRLGEDLLEADMTRPEINLWQPVDRSLAHKITYPEREACNRTTKSMERPYIQENLRSSVESRGKYYIDHTSTLREDHQERLDNNMMYGSQMHPIDVEHQIPSPMARKQERYNGIYDTSDPGPLTHSHYEPPTRRDLRQASRGIENRGLQNFAYRAEDGHLSPTKHSSSHTPQTPSPQRRDLRSYNRREPVTSPFFKRQGAIPDSGSSRITLNPKPMSSRTSQRANSSYKMSPQRPPPTGRHALNSLSFVNPPDRTTDWLNQNQLINSSTRSPAYSRQLISSHESSWDSQGLIRRPDQVALPASSYEAPRTQYMRSPVRQSVNLRDIPPLKSSTPSVASTFYPLHREGQNRQYSKDPRDSRRQGGSALGRSGASRPSKEGTRRGLDLHLGDYLDGGIGVQVGSSSSSNGRRIARR